MGATHNFAEVAQSLPIKSGKRNPSVRGQREEPQVLWLANFWLEQFSLPRGFEFRFFFNLRQKGPELAFL